jgi:hypothetical protein
MQATATNKINIDRCRKKAEKAENGGSLAGFAEFEVLGAGRRSFTLSFMSQPVIVI